MTQRIASGVLSFVLIFCLLISAALPVGAAGTGNAAGIEYAFLYEEPGLAGGSVTIHNASLSGKVALCWASRGQALEGYSPLAEVELAPAADTVVEVQKFTAIPEGAQQLACYQDGVLVPSLIYTIPAGKRTALGKKLYSFGSVSDVHLPTNDGDDFRRALAFFKAYGCSFVGISGDIANDGSAAQLEMYQSIVSPYDDSMPVYVSAGNHDAQGGGLNQAQWEQYTGHPQQFVIEEPTTGDIFIFLGDNNWPNDSNNQTVLTMAQINWLADRLEMYKDRRVYLYQHVFLGDTCGEVYDAAGNPVYGVWFKPDRVEENAYRDLMRKYNNVTWFSGHSHWKYYLQSNNADLNVYDGAGEYCQMVHIPSLTVPRDYIDGERVEDSANSEGYIVDVYRDYTVLRGYDFENGQHYAYATYALSRAVSAEPEIAHFSVSPGEVYLVPGGSAALSAKVVGRNGADEGVDWFSDVGEKLAVSSDGRLRAAADLAYGDYTVTAVSRADPEKTCTVRVMVGTEDGSKTYPYLIKNTEDFLRLTAAMNAGETYRDKYFLQTADITLPEGYGGVGNTKEFLGIYNGNGYTIRATLQHDNRNTLFGYIGNDSSQGILMNLCADVTVKSAEYGSGMAYSIRRYGLAINCYSVSDVTAGGRASCLFSSVYGYAYNCFGAGQTRSTGGESTGGVAAQWNGASDRLQNVFYLDTCGAGGSASSNAAGQKNMTAADLAGTAFFAELRAGAQMADSFLAANGFVSVSAADLSDWKAGENRPAFRQKEGEVGISACRIGGVDAAIEDGRIVVTLPKGTDLSALSWEIVLKGEKASCDLKEEVVDFSDPVCFAVRAENGLLQTYTVLATAESGRPGDVDQDGAVTVSDVVELRKIIVVGNWTAVQFAAGNLDGDETLSVSDVVELRKRIVRG
ncbi:MAG: metallophosphoesterase [Candidatus Howiella sp.]